MLGAVACRWLGAVPLLLTAISLLLATIGTALLLASIATLLLLATIATLLPSISG